jgi:hypothetical protein
MFTKGFIRFVEWYVKDLERLFTRDEVDYILKLTSSPEADRIIGLLDYSQKVSEKLVSGIRKKLEVTEPIEISPTEDLYTFLLNEYLLQKEMEPQFHDPFIEQFYDPLIEERDRLFVDSYGEKVVETIMKQLSDSLQMNNITSFVEKLEDIRKQLAMQNVESKYSRYLMSALIQTMPQLMYESASKSRYNLFQITSSILKELELYGEQCLQIESIVEKTPSIQYYAEHLIKISQLQDYFSPMVLLVQSYREALLCVQDRATNSTAAIKRAAFKICKQKSDLYESETIKVPQWNLNLDALIDERTKQIWNSFNHHYIILEDQQSDILQNLETFKSADLYYEIFYKEQTAVRNRKVSVKFASLLDKMVENGLISVLTDEIDRVVFTHSQHIQDTNFPTQKSLMHTVKNKVDDSFSPDRTSLKSLGKHKADRSPVPKWISMLRARHGECWGIGILTVTLCAVNYVAIPGVHHTLTAANRSPLTVGSQLLMEPTNKNRSGFPLHRSEEIAPQSTRENSIFLATWYGPEVQDQLTASGERFNYREMTIAHPYLPFGSWINVLNPKTEKSVLARVTDRPPIDLKRQVILSLGVAEKLDLTDDGRAEVIVNSTSLSHL